MYIRDDLEIAAAKQLSLDLNCTPEDFYKYENTVTEPVIKEGRRLLTDKPPFFRAATMGMGTVVCASAEIMPFAKALAAEKSGTELCSAETIAVLNRELFSYGYCIGHFNQYYLPKTPYRPNMKSHGFSMSVFEGENIKELYGYKGFSNALMYKAEGERRDIIAVCAVNGMRIMGIAGASNDSSTMAQIGIDVLPEFRGMGVASALVSACASEVFRSGYIPYYGTWTGNIMSQRVAAACGFRPAWCEMSSAKRE